MNPALPRMDAVGSSLLDEREVHVFGVRTQAPPETVARFAEVLAPPERERADRYRFEHLRTAFVLARGALRLLLGCYLHAPAAGIRFEYGLRGKPALPSGHGLHFNTSHSGGLALFAFTLGCELGIDVEWIRPLDDLQNLARRFFCAEETADLLALPAEHQVQAFFRCWTRKEAYVKATGDGLAVPLDDFRVELRPGEPSRFIHIGGDAGATEAWTLHALEFGPDYAAALAYRDTRRPVRVFAGVEPAFLLE